MNTEIITVRPSPTVVGHFNVYLEKSHSSHCFHRGLTAHMALLEGRELADRLSIPLKTYLQPKLHTLKYRMYS